jgi:hypothetical protein
VSPAAKRFVSSVKEIAAARQPAVGFSYMASEWLGKIVIVWGLSVIRSVGFSILLGKFQFVEEDMDKNIGEWL